MKIANLIGFAIACAAGSMVILTMQIIRLDNNASTQRYIQEGAERQAAAVVADTSDTILEPQPLFDATRRAKLPDGVTAATPLQQLVDAIVLANNPLLKQAPLRPSTVTLVSGIWDVGRGDMATSAQWEVLKRPFSHYINGLKQFLAYKIPKVLFVDPELYSDVKAMVEEAVENGAGPTRVLLRTLADVRRGFGYGDAVNAIRSNKQWLAQGGPLVANSPQALLEGFNPLVMSKLRLTRDAARWNPFDTDGFLWLDGSCLHATIAPVVGCAY